MWFMKRSVKAQRWTFSHHLLIFIWIIEFFPHIHTFISHAMCMHTFSDSGNNSNIFFLSLRTWTRKILVCYQLVNKPHDCVNVLQDIWEDNVTIINFFYNFIAWKVLVSYTLCICIYHNQFTGCLLCTDLFCTQYKALTLFYISTFLLYT